FWLLIARYSKHLPGAHSYPPRRWLLLTIAWLLLSILHPGINSPIAACAQVALYISVLSPAFWAPSVLVSSRQISRLMAILFLSNAFGSVLGIAQVYRPDTFNPPYIPAMQGRYEGEDLKYQADDGRKILRPCGLTDTPGGAAPGGAAAALIGLCWALR